jgi:hypothetical protein
LKSTKIIFLTQIKWNFIYFCLSSFEKKKNKLISFVQVTTTKKTCTAIYFKKRSKQESCKKQASFGENSLHAFFSLSLLRAKREHKKQSKKEFSHPISDFNLFNSGVGSLYKAHANYP